MATRTLEKRGYSQGKTCPECGKVVSDKSTYCREHAKVGRPIGDIPRSPRTRPPTALCSCGLALGDHPQCQACGSRICSHFSYDSLVDYRGIEVCPYCYEFWRKMEQKEGREITAKEFQKWGK